MHSIIENLFKQNSVNDEHHIALAHYIVYIMSVVTLALWACFLIAFCTCCIPRPLRNFIGWLAVILLVATLIVTFVVTDRIENTVTTSVRVARKSEKLFVLLTAEDE